jgi:hypothetical protein
MVEIHTELGNGGGHGDRGDTYPADATQPASNPDSRSFRQRSNFRRAPEYRRDPNGTLLRIVEAFWRSFSSQNAGQTPSAPKTSQPPSFASGRFVMV